MATHTASKNREPLSGLVERVTFHSPETGFCEEVFDVIESDPERLLKLKGKRAGQPDVRGPLTVRLGRAQPSPGRRGRPVRGPTGP